MLQKQGMPMFASQTSHTSNWGSLVVLQIPARQWPRYLARKIVVWWSSASLRLLVSILRQTPSIAFNMIQPTVDALCLSGLHHIVRCNCRWSNQECYLNTNTTPDSCLSRVVLTKMDQLPLLKLKDGFLLVLDVLASRIKFSTLLLTFHIETTWSHQLPLAEGLPQKHVSKSCVTILASGKDACQKNAHQGSIRTTCFRRAMPFEKAHLQNLSEFWLREFCVCNNAWSFGPGKCNLGPPQGHLRERKLSTLKFCTLRKRLQTYIMLLAISEIGESAIWFLLFWKHQVNLNSKKSAIYESNTRPRNLAMAPWWKVPSALCEQHHRFCCWSL